MEKFVKLWKIIKEIGIVIVFIGSALFAYGKCTANEVNIDTNNKQNVTREFTSLKEANNEILKELKTVKKEVQAISKDYKMLKLKLFKTNIIEDFGDFVYLNRDEKPHKPEKRIAEKALIIAIKNSDFMDFFDDLSY